MPNILPAPSGDCHRCRLFHGKWVGGYAPKADVKLVVVGPYPMSEDERRGIPFVSPTGQMLRDALRAIKLDPDEDVAYLYALRCSPMGREIKETNLKACRYWLAPELEQISCKTFLLTGPEAAKSLIPVPLRTDATGKEIAMAKLRGRWFEDATKRRMRVTFNPAYVDRMSPIAIDGNANVLLNPLGKPRKIAPLGTVPNFFWQDIKAVGQELGTI